MLIIGVKESSMLNSVFTILNIAVILFIVIAGSIKANFDNWKLKPNVNRLKVFFFADQKIITEKIKANTTFFDINNQSQTCSFENNNSTVDCGSGGFFPYGLNGILKF